MRRESVFGVKRPCCDQPCFSFVLRKCWWNAVFSPSTAFRFSGRLGRKDTAAGSLNVVLQPRGSDWAGNKLLAVTQIPFSWSLAWCLAAGWVCWADLYGLAVVQHSSGRCCLAAKQDLAERILMGSLCWATSKLLTLQSCHHCNNYHANHSYFRHAVPFHGHSAFT